MAEIASAIIQAATLPRRAAPAAQTLATVEVTLLQAPDKIATANRLIETSGLIQTAPNSASVTLATALGTIELTLAQLVGERERQQILQLLTNLYQRRAVVTLLIAPDSGAPQQAQLKATLLAPDIPLPAQPQPAAAPQQPASSPVTAPPIQPAGMALPNAPLRAIVLPSSPPAAATTAQPVFVPSPSSSAAPTEPPRQPPPTPFPQQQTPTQSATPAYQIYDKTLRIALNALQDVQNAALRNPLPTEPLLKPTTAQQALAPMQPPASAPPPELAAGQEVFLRIAPPSSLPPPPPSPNATAQWQTQQPLTAPAEPPPTWQGLATLEAKGADGQAILKSSGNVTFFIPANASPSPLTQAPVGSQWLVALEPPPQPQTALSADTSSQRLPDANALPEWLDALNQMSMNAPDSPLPLTLPRFPIATNNAQQLGAGLLFFLNAVKGHDWRAWLDDNAAQRPSLAAGPSRLQDKAQEALRKAVHDEESANGDVWRAYSLPLSEQDMATGAATHYPVLYVRKDRQEASHDDGDSRSRQTQIGSRFLIDMTLSRLGAFQLDGLVGAKKIDMILRSETPLPDAMKAEIKALYEQTLSAFGYAGLMQFQTGRARWTVFRKSGAPAPVTT